MKTQCIILIGMAGSGKSTVGRALAQKLGYAFTDLDLYIRDKGYRSIQDIIDTQGETALLHLEKEYMYQIDLDRRVISPGGSLIYQPDLMLYLREKAVLVYLDEDFSTIEKRLHDPASRGIVGLKNHTLQEVFEERRPLYQKYADIIVKSTDKPLNSLVTEIVQGIQVKYH